MATILNKKIAIIAFSLSISLFSFNQQSYWIFNIIPIILLFYLSGKRKIRLSLKNKNIVILFFLFLVWIVLTGFISGNYREPLRKSIEIMLCLLLLVAILTTVKEKNDYIVFLHGVMYSGVIISTYLILLGIKSSFEINFSHSLISKNPSGLHLAIATIAIVYLMKINIAHKYFYFIIYSIVGFSLVLTLSVKSIISFIIITLYLLITNKSIIFFFIAPILYAFYSTTFIDNIENSKNYFFISNKIQSALGYTTNTFSDDSIYTRQQIKQEALEIFYDNPFFGVGLENTREIIGTYSHHHWIELMAGGGIMAVIFFALPIFYIIVVTYQNRKNQLFSLTLLSLLIILIISYGQRLYDSYSFFILVSMMFMSSNHKLNHTLK